MLRRARPAVLAQDSSAVGRFGSVTDRAGTARCGGSTRLGQRRAEGGGEQRLAGDGDGLLDLATANALESDVSILLGNAAYDIEVPSTLFLGGGVRQAGRGPQALAAANLCGDSRPELIVVNNYDNSMSMMVNDGQFLFYSYNTVEFSTGDGPIDVECADFDGDGDNDVAVLNQNANTVTILFNQTIQ